jgi:hypothetical protein
VGVIGDGWWLVVGGWWLVVGDNGQQVFGISWTYMSYPSYPSYI